MVSAEPVVSSWSDYYAFGWEMPGRKWNDGDGHRYGFNGMEVDNEFTNSTTHLDFGARIYDSRIGRWLTRDALEAYYSDGSPYVFALNSPIQAIDPDGNVVIFINGLDLRGNGGTNAYWRNIGTDGKAYNWDEAAMNQIGDNNAHYVDGSPYAESIMEGAFGPAASTEFRVKMGRKQGKIDAVDIIKNLKKDETGKIIETVKIVAHSMGPAFAKGYAKGLNDYVKEYNKIHPKEPIEGFEIEFEVDIAAYYNKSSTKEKAMMAADKKSVTTTYRMEGDVDETSGPPQHLEGTVEIKTEKGTQHQLFKIYDDGSFNYNPTSLPESRDKAGPKPPLAPTQSTPPRVNRSN